MKLLPGSPHPLGANWDGDGVNFALYSENATGVDLCLFDEAGVETRMAMTSRSAYVWHAYAPGVCPGQRYGFRVDGPYEPQRGLRFNSRVVLLDPYAKAVDGVEQWEKGCFSYEVGAPEGDGRPTEKEQLGAPRGVVVDQSFEWEGDAPLRTPLHRSVIYEAHVRGLTKLHPDVPEGIRGTYAGIAHPAIVGYLRDLGITAIELMPVHCFVDDKMLLDKGLRNYWGYNTIGFFAPDVRYRRGSTVGSEVREFKEMVKALHRAGIEVILDVVYNHTAEGNHLGPTFNFKGIDNTTYYRLVADDPRHYFDYTGTGNTLNVRHPQVLTLIMDSLRYWATEMHVDGFRFDLASALARQLHDVDRLSSFFTSIHQSPDLGEVKLIAEPWDVGDGGYQVGNFPVRWAEWNGRYRDAVRAFWRGDSGKAAEIGYRITGSSDLYESNGRRPSASINLVTAHDGFTLNDLVSFNAKHNDANGEKNQDGNNHESSWNCGVEGDTDDEGVKALRRRQRRNLLSTLLLSQGTPMLVAGDEFGRSQAGNNNAYCQDNSISWVHWDWTDEQRELHAFSRRLLHLRNKHPALARASFFQGRPLYGTEVQDLLWFRHDGQPMSGEDWNNPGTQSFMMFLAGRGIGDLDAEGRPLVDDNLLWLVNASHVDLTATMPTLPAVRERWELLVDTTDDHARESLAAGETTSLPGRSVKFFRAPSRVIRTGGAVHALLSTYRLQFTPAFGFRQAREVIDYLEALGITDVYASPLLAAARGSTHGYDVVDHTRLNDELGTEQDFADLTDTLRARGMGLLLDWVPNHMGIANGQNAAWDDVLENGPSSVHAETFDIDWSPPREDLKGRVLLPILGHQYGKVLESGELRVVWEAGTFRLAYGERRLPLGPKSLQPVLEALNAKANFEEGSAAQQELESILSALRHLPDRHQTAPTLRKERAREKEVVKRRFVQLVEQSAAVAEALPEVLNELNGQPGVATSFDELDAILQNQSYRLASWRVAAEEINYRRFFDINDLAAIRMESPTVFERAHAMLFKLMDQHRVNALRLDHTDGLYDPFAYFEALQRRFVPAAADPERSPDDAARPLAILVEKILEPGERLPARWPVDGTTGYEFTSSVGALWVDSNAEDALTKLYQRFTGDRASFAEHVYESKQQILRHSLASEVNMLARRLERMTSKDRRWRDFTLASLTRALTEVIAAFPVYRTYLREGERPSDEDQRRIREAITLARGRAGSISGTVFDFLEALLLLRTEGSDEARAEHAAFALRFQQLTGPAMAKSVEDTAFYRYNRLICLNEVGGTPSKFGTRIEELHAQNAERASSWPLSMLATSTHDTKRGEDTSARIAVLSEMVEPWRRAVERWGNLASGLKTSVNGRAAPSRALEYLLYQTLVGCWPLGWDGRGDRAQLVERLKAYLHKASNEAKVDTSWTNPNDAYDAALDVFVDGLFTNDAFVEDVRRFAEAVAPHGASNGLAQTLLRLVAPGIPDTYQGSELWNQALVDPDNRRQVDYATRHAMLTSMRGGEAPAASASGLLDHFEDGAIKLYVVQAVLAERKARRELFLRGDYTPLTGDEHLFAFTRGAGADRLICCVPRLVHLLTEGRSRWAIGDAWGERTISVPHPGRYRDVLTRAIVDVSSTARLADLFAQFPLVLLVAEGQSQ